MHYQFETIHPFPDGSGRLGRLLIPLVLLARGRLRAPLLDPSPEIKSRRQEYVDRLLAVSLEGRWTEWIAFFLEIARGSSRESIDLTSRLEALREDYLRKVQEARSAGLLAKLIDRIFAQPLLSIPQAQKLLREQGHHFAYSVQRDAELLYQRAGCLIKVHDRGSLAGTSTATTDQRKSVCRPFVALPLSDASCSDNESEDGRSAS